MTKTLILDTNVYLTEISSLFAFGKNDIAIPTIILDEIDKQKQRQDTAGYNARMMNRVLDNLRRKGSLFEGGIREPGIMHWPSKIQKGVVSNEPCASMDIAPTLLDAAGVDLNKYSLDGKSLLELPKGNFKDKERILFWEFLDQTAVRKGKWKLVLKGKLIESYGDVPEVHLANLEEDMSESNNLADEEPEITKELRNLAENWRKRIEEKWIKEYGAPNEEQRLNTQMGLK